MRKGTEELRKFGSFEGGVFRRNDDVEGRRNTDAYQAIWEHVHGRRMDYPKPRYGDPIMLDPANHEWLAVAGMPGVSHKSLGTFTERECAAALVRLAPGATYLAGARGVHLILSGSGAVQKEPFRQMTAFHLGDGETAEIAAREETEFLRLVLPDLSGLKVHQPARIEAAE